MRKFIAALLAPALIAVADAPAYSAEKPCDRACLEGLVGAYLTALPTHDASKLPGGRTLRFIENDQLLKPGQGTWVSVSALGHYRHVFADPQDGTAAVITTVTENGKGAILDLVIKVRNRQIVEAESQIIRDANGAALYEKLGAPAPEWLQPAPPADRVSRDVLVGTADKYLKGMIRDDPKGDYSFFDPDCNRIEHAAQTTNVKTPEAYGHSSDVDFSSMGCEAQYKTGFLGFVTDIRDRRFPVVDEERQAVFAFADLDHNGTVRVLHLSTGKDFVIPPYFNVPRSLQAGEAYRMRGDKLWRIEMTLTELPYGMRPAGTEPPPGPAPAPPPKGKAAPPPPCDRDCLQDLLVRTMQAMADHRPADAPLAPTVRYTENGQLLKPGDGIWNTATALAMPGDGLSSLGPAISAYKLFLADPATGQAACLCSTNENGTPGVMAIRIKAAAGKVSEIEAVIVRQEVSGSRGGTMTLFRTPVLAEFTPKGFSQIDPALTRPPAVSSIGKILVVDVNRYFDALAYNLHAPQPAVIEGSTRLNGNALQGMVPPAMVRERRVWLTDEDSGLALAVAVLDHDGSGPPGIPTSNLMAGVFKVDSGKIVRVEAIERPVPYGMETGWTP
jgi:hypothetical protein